MTIFTLCVAAKFCSTSAWPWPADAVVEVETGLEVAAARVGRRLRAGAREVLAVDAAADVDLAPPSNDGSRGSSPRCSPRCRCRPSTRARRSTTSCRWCCPPIGRPHRRSRSRRRSRPTASRHQGRRRPPALPRRLRAFHCPPTQLRARLANVVAPSDPPGFSGTAIRTDDPPQSTDGRDSCHGWRHGSSAGSRRSAPRAV